MTNFEKVGHFMKTFGQEVKTNSELSSEKINNLRISLINEELEEFKEAIKNQDLKEAMEKDTSVVVHLILIASLRDEAKDMTAKLPAGRVHICFDNTELPTVIRKILTSDTGIDY